MADEIINIRYKHIHETKPAEEALNRQKGLLEQLAQKEKDLIAARNKSNDVSSIKKLNAEIEATKTKMGQLTGATQNAGKATSELGQLMQRAGQAFALTAVIGALASVTKSAVMAAAEFEQLQISFTTMLGSAEKAKILLQGLSDFAEKTPFELNQLTEASKKLLAFGFQANEIIPTLKKIGDVSAGTGKDIGELAVIYGQVRLAGRLMGQDLMQFTNAGVPLIRELAKNFGVAESEIKKMVEAGEIGFSDVEKAMQTMTGQGGLFFDMMQKQSETTLGKWSTFKDTLITGLREIGMELKPVTDRMLDFASGAVQGLILLGKGITNQQVYLRAADQIENDLDLRAKRIRKKLGRDVTTEEQMEFVKKQISKVTEEIERMEKSGANSEGIDRLKGSLVGYEKALNQLTLQQGNVVEQEKTLTEKQKKENEKRQKEAQKLKEAELKFEENFKQQFLEDRAELNDKLEKESLKEVDDRIKARQDEEDLKREMDKDSREHEAKIIAESLEDYKKAEEEKAAAAKRQAELRNEIAQNAKDIIANTIQFELDGVDAAIKKQEDKVKAAEKLAEKGNIAQLKAEQERLDELQKKRENFVKAQKILSAIEFTANMAIAISKAAAEGGGLFSMATIAAVLAAVAGGISQVSGFVNGFEKGGYTGDGGNKDAAGIVHKREFVFDAQKTAENREFFEAIHTGKIQPKKLFSMGNVPQQRMIDYGALVVDTTAVINEKLDNIYKAIKSQQGVTLTFDENGFNAVVNTYIERNGRSKALKHR